MSVVLRLVAALLVFLTLGVTADEDLPGSFTCDASTDDCEYKYDGECDDAGVFCATGTDCFDCDPCMELADQGCEACTAGGCFYCNSDTQPLCISGGSSDWPSDSACVAEDFVGDVSFCSDPTDPPVGGTDPTEPPVGETDPTEPPVGGTDPTDPPIDPPIDPPVDPPIDPPIDPPTTDPPPQGGTCNEGVDTCGFQFDGVCDAGADCDAGSDCFDCDPCMKYRFDGCEVCTSAPEGCGWCDSDAICISYGTPILPPFISEGCKAIIDTCGSLSDSNYFSDPLYGAANWIFDMINVKPVWDSGITGKGINIRINDNGVDGNHPDLVDNFDASLSCPVYEAGPIDPADPSGGNHGTTCAALAAAAANTEGGCSVGVAHGATISACRNLAYDAEDDSDPFLSYLALEKYIYDPDGPHVDVSSNSWGQDACASQRRRRDRRRLQDICPFNSETSPDGLNDSPCSASDCQGADWSGGTADLPEACESYIIQYCARYSETEVNGCTEYLDLYVDCSYRSTMTELLEETFARGVTEGRDGKGIIYTIAAGNEYNMYEDINTEGELNSRYTISVGAVGKNKLHTWYSTTGSALFVSAPGGDTRDSFTNNVVSAVGGGCLEATEGTSYATPIVSGVVALVLEANPAVGWRDVQGILASTTQMTDTDNAEKPWITNAAGYHHSYFYGFGIVDAGAAVEAAKSWTIYDEELNISGESGVIDLAIPEHDEGSASSTISISTEKDFVTESVVVFLNIAHLHRGDLDVVLTSPSGTRSLLAPGKRPENTQVEESWQLMTVRNWGEAADGEWTITMTDISPGTELESCYSVPNWEVYLEDLDVVVTCQSMTSFGCCFDGAYDTSPECSVPSDEDGLGPGDACCECGGGGPSTASNTLRSWRLEVYGRIDPEHTGRPTTDDDDTPGQDDDDTPGQDDDDAGGEGDTASCLVVRHYLLLIAILAISSITAM